MPKKTNNNNFETCPTCGHKKRLNKQEREEEQKEKEIYKCLKCGREYQHKTSFLKHKKNSCYNYSLTCPKCNENFHFTDTIDKIIDHIYECDKNGEILKNYVNEPNEIREKIKEMIEHIYDEQIKQNYEDLNN